MIKEPDKKLRFAQLRDLLRKLEIDEDKIMNGKSRYISAAVLLVILGFFLIYTLCFPGEYPQTMYVAVMACKVRAGAGHEFDVVGMLPQDEAVTVLGIAEDKEHRTWYKIDPGRLSEGTIIDSEAYYIRSDLLVMNPPYD